MNRIKSIQGIRALAILMVFLSHTQTFISTDLSFFLSWGRKGVYIFILISGMLLAIGTPKAYRGTFYEGITLVFKKVKKLYWLHFIMWLFMLIFTWNKLSLVIFCLTILSFISSDISRLYKHASIADGVFILESMI